MSETKQLQMADVGEDSALSQILGASGVNSVPEPIISYLWLGVVFLVVFAMGLSWLVTRHFWHDFAVKQKWLARAALGLMIIVLLGPSARLAESWVLLQPGVGQMTLEDPNLIAVALKAGAYNFQQHDQLAGKLPQEKHELYKCVYAASYYQATKHILACGKDMKCMQEIPASSRETIMAFIKDLKTLPPSENKKEDLARARALEACTRVRL